MCCTCSSSCSHSRCRTSMLQCVAVCCIIANRCCSMLHLSHLFFSLLLSPPLPHLIVHPLPQNSYPSPDAPAAPSLNQVRDQINVLAPLSPHLLPHLPPTREETHVRRLAPLRRQDTGAQAKAPRSLENFSKGQLAIKWTTQHDDNTDF